mmetsp:Transcript_7758/g.14445  ORF Transcript_7758/g.14445 Transcript_7758/m.14445 type:complete len:311 (+) Transcript_7758:248-1180(+)
MSTCRPCSRQLNAAASACSLVTIDPLRCSRPFFRLPAWLWSFPRADSESAWLSVSSSSYRMLTWLGSDCVAHHSRPSLLCIMSATSTVSSAIAWKRAQAKTAFSSMSSATWSPGSASNEASWKLFLLLLASVEAASSCSDVLDTSGSAAVAGDAHLAAWSSSRASYPMASLFRASSSRRQFSWADAPKSCRQLIDPCQPRPHTVYSPFRRRARLWHPPAAISETPERTLVGSRISGITSCITQPCMLQPQPTNSCPSKRAKAWLCPAAICFTPSRMTTGTCRCAVSPSPSRPLVLQPKERSCSLSVTTRE